ncbi:MAG: tripartite tricarboxylate transporter substrate binding protein [Oscillospiraceae bacterium]|nr:tripartite tricarboxylate transporter substrate binding protein [Oscillospiraceae bacterium]
MKKFFVLLLALAMVFALAACGETNTNTETTEEPAAFPGDGTVTMVVPFDPGSGDTEARMFAQYVSKYLGTTIVATNISGGGGGVGTQSVINSAADGYTYGFASASIAYGMANGNIDASPDDVQLLCTFNGDWMGVFVPKDSPFQSFEDLVAYAKNHPDELLVGGTNVGSAHHSFYVTLANDAGIECTYVPYGGANDTVLAFLGGELDAAVLSPSSIRQYMETDGVRLLTLSTKERVTEFPDVPTAYELGYKDVADIIQFRAYLAPAGVPEEVLEAYDKATEQAFNDPEYQQYLADNNLTPFYKNHAEAEEYFDQFVETAKVAASLMG